MKEAETELEVIPHNVMLLMGNSLFTQAMNTSENIADSHANHTIKQINILIHSRYVVPDITYTIS